jgi:hypothetical protein
MAVDDWFLSTSNTIHEVAHWIVSDPERRNLPDFGLGIGPESKLFSKEIAEDPQTEEERASVLGILYERALGLDWKRTFQWHCWNESWDNHKSFIRIYQWLRDQGLVKWGGTPIVMP